MSPAIVVLIGSTMLAVIAVVVIVSPPSELDPSAARLPDPGLAQRTALAAVAGVVVVALSGWVVPAVVVAVASWFAIRGVQRRDRGRGDDVARTDALASWIENLRDVLLAGDQPIGAIAATVSTAPGPVRPAVRRLAAALGRQDPDVAFRRFADELDDPLGDLVAAGLLIAVQRGARTVAVLSALATQARDQADRRRIVEAERAPLRREVLLLSAIMAALVVVLLVFGRAEYLEPYGTGAGQLFLGGVLAIYAVLLVRVNRLARLPRPRRFISEVIR